MDVTRPTRDGQGSPKPASHGKIKKRPVGHRRRLSLNVQDCRRLAGEEGHVQMPQRKRQACAVCFHHGLFSRPTREEGRLVFGGRQAEKRLQFFRAAHALGQLRVIQGIPVAFEIKTHFHILREGIHGQMACVRDVEMNKGTSRVLQERLSMGTRSKPDVLGPNAEVATEKVSQEPACRNETAPVFRPDQALRTCMLVRDQEVLTHLKAWKGEVYNPAPHVDVTRQQSALRRRHAPEGWRGNGLRQGVLHV